MGTDREEREVTLKKIWSKADSDFLGHLEKLITLEDYWSLNEVVEMIYFVGEICVSTGWWFHWMCKTGLQGSRGEQ